MPSSDVVQAAIANARELRGLVGADSLRRTHSGLSRRQAAAIKRETMTRLERERRDACRRVVVTTPGITPRLRCDGSPVGRTEPRDVLVAQPMLRPTSDDADASRW